MTDQNSREYYQRRSARERELALDAASPKIAEIHSELADRYDLLAKKASPPELRLVGKPLNSETRAIWQSGEAVGGSS